MILGNRGRGGLGLLGRLRGHRGMGVSSALVNGSLVYSNPISRPIGPARPVTGGGGGIHPVSPTPPAPASTIPAPTFTLSQLWQYYQQGTTLTAEQMSRLQNAGYLTGGSGSGIRPLGPPGYSGGSQNPNLPTSQNNLAQLTLLYQSNPAALTQQQWNQLQAAGVIPSTVPYSDSSLVNPLASSASASTATDSGIDPSTGVPYSTELAEAEAAGSSGSIGTTLSADYGGIPLYGWLAGGVVLYLLMSKKR